MGWLPPKKVLPPRSAWTAWRSRAPRRSCAAARTSCTRPCAAMAAPWWRCRSRCGRRRRQKTWGKVGENWEKMEKKWRKSREKLGKQGNNGENQGKNGEDIWRKIGNMGDFGSTWTKNQPENHLVENVGFKLSKLNQIGSLVILSKMSMYEQTLQTMIWKVLRCYFVFDSFNFLACQNINGTFEELKHGSIVPFLFAIYFGEIP